MPRIYVDYAGAGVPSEKQLSAWAAALPQLVLSNPHSHHATALQTSSIIQMARQRILIFVNADPSEYEVIFTHNTTHALKLVAECFDYAQKMHLDYEPAIGTLANLTNGQSTLLMLRDSHTSVIGMRELKSYHQLVVTDFDHLDRFLDAHSRVTSTTSTATSSSTRSLFVLTAESNFCGRKYDLRIVKKLKRVLGSSWRVCLDAAAWVPTAPLDVTQCDADFVTFSFYKLLGYPTGLGALVVRRCEAMMMCKRYMGGGTVETLVTTRFEHRLKASTSERFEDGTLNCYAIAALKFGFDDLEAQGGMLAIEQHCGTLAARLHHYLITQRHENGAPLARVYGDGWRGDGAQHERQGAIVNFNLLRDDGSAVGFVEVEKMCDLFEIELRTGCMCNQGACFTHLGLTPTDFARQVELGKQCDDTLDLVDGRPIGSVRVSFGRLNTMEVDEAVLLVITEPLQEVEKIENMIACCFLNSRIEPLIVQPLSKSRRASGARLRRLFVYPVKSAAPITPRRWSLGRRGLDWDRHWMLVSGDGVPLTQKRWPALCSIQPSIETDSLVLADRHGLASGSLSLPLLVDKENQKLRGVGRSADISRCPKDVRVSDCGDTAARWLQNFDLPADARLVHIGYDDRASSSGANFANVAEFLLLTRASIENIAARTGLEVAAVERRFRANFIIDTESAIPYEEDEFARVHIGSVPFEVIGKCTRCQMICIDQSTGEKNANVLLALRDLRAGQMTFGVYLRATQPTQRDVVEGACVYIERHVDRKGEKASS